MDTQQYSLSWNHFTSNLSIGFQSLFREQDFVDVTLAVDGKYFKAHKTVLSVCSPYFKELFHANPCKHPIIILQDVEHKILKNLLVFIYQGEVKVNQDDLPAFMKVAEMLKVKGLTENSGEYNNGKQLCAHYQKYNRDTDLNQLCSLQAHDQIVAQSKCMQPKPLNYPQIESPTISTVKQDTKRTKSHPSNVDCELIHNLDSIGLPVQPKKKKESLSLVFANRQFDDMICQEKQALKTVSPITDIKLEPSDIDSAKDIKSIKIGIDVDTTIGKGHEECTGGNGDAIEIDVHQISENASKGPGDRAMILKSKRGLPVLIHNGHIYTKYSGEPTRTTWVCVKQRNLHCGGCLTTGLLEHNVVSYSGHNHSQLHDIIRRLQMYGTSLGSGSSNCDSSSNSSPSHNSERHEFAMEPTDLSYSSTNSASPYH